MKQKIKGLSKTVLLVILDGFGIRENTLKNAIADAKTPNLKYLFENFPFTKIIAGGEAVGLPSGVAGNSEVGHINIGAGKPVRQDLVRINEAIKKQQLASMPKMTELIDESKKNGGRIHLLGLLSDGGVHSHIDHLKEIIRLLKQVGEIKIFLHLFMDGRDTARDSGINYLTEISKISGISIASIQGRSIGMDRDRRWEKIERAYKTFIGETSIEQTNPIEYLNSQYQKGIFDEFIEPALFTKDGAIRKDDSVFFFNFRPDRAKQITLAFTDKNFNYFKVTVKPKYFLCMTPYVQDEVPLPILFDKEKVSGGLCEFLSNQGHKQFKIAETEKYAHVTYFFNGGEEKNFLNEDRVLVPSPKEVPTYDKKPEMSAPEVLSKLLQAVDKQTYTLLVVNFANSDMVGHTGNYEAAKKAIEYLDFAIGELTKSCEKNKVSMIVTADHGNSDQMIYPDGNPHTSHTDSPVPFVLVHPKLKGEKAQEKNDKKFALKDIAPTILNILDIDIPSNMTGKSIF